MTKRLLRAADHAASFEIRLFSGEVTRSFFMKCDTLLLTVEDNFLIHGRGLVVVPPIDLPPEPIRFIPFSTEVRIERPDGTELQVIVKFAVVHFLLLSGESKWHTAPMIPDGTKASVPIGSRLFVGEATMKRREGIDTGPAVE